MSTIEFPDYYNTEFAPVLTQYPTTDASKAGQQFFYKGEMWRYLTVGETALPAGTPWPAKGYKVIEGIIFRHGPGSQIKVNITKSDFSPLRGEDGIQYNSSSTGQGTIDSFPGLTPSQVAVPNVAQTIDSISYQDDFGHLRHAIVRHQGDFKFKIENRDTYGSLIGAAGQPNGPKMSLKFYPLGT